MAESEERMLSCAIENGNVSRHAGHARQPVPQTPVGLAYELRLLLREGSCFAFYDAHPALAALPLPVALGVDIDACLTGRVQNGLPFFLGDFLQGRGKKYFVTLHDLESLLLCQ